jgi:catechol 2,3-dioxygenase-like lactoylglutathione lyase family enzyme
MGAMAPVRISALDHIVLRSTDIERSLAWYCDELGLQPERVDEWRAGKTFFPSVRVSAETVIDLFPANEAPADKNLDHFCLVVDPADFDALKASGRFEVVDGPATRWGARGDATSIYVRDPDGNVVELRYYGDR